MRKRQNAEANLAEESIKLQKQLETENKDLRKTVCKQAKMIVGLKSGTSTVYRRPSKGWSEYSRQQRYNIKKEIAGNVCSALSFCDEACLKPRKVEMENISEGTIEILNVSTGEFEGKRVGDRKPFSSKHTALYLKDKLAISNSGYQELSMISDLPRFNQLKKCASTLNAQFEIRDAPEGIVGVQQSIKSRLKLLLTHIIHNFRENGAKIPDVIHVKLTGDGTQIARGLTVLNFAFTILEEPGQKAMSVGGNHSIAILKVKESDYDELFHSLSDIIQEAKDLQCITVEESVFRIEYFLGGDLKFLAIICGIESASCDHACIWCKCPKADRHDMTKE